MAKGTDDSGNLESLIEMLVAKGALGGDPELNELIKRKYRKAEAAEQLTKDQKEAFARTLIQENQQREAQRKAEQAACPHIKELGNGPRTGGQTYSDYTLRVACLWCGKEWKGKIGEPLKDEFNQVMPQHLMPPMQRIGGSIPLTSIT